ncbi:pentapeptide repeat-containing protein [Streptomyces microflavus]|uniref:pentapeptide repeat-containing protein n=1 Tax=Streptomyces microflavus TaxID=1919 RepID=UPI0036BBA277
MRPSSHAAPEPQPVSLSAPLAALRHRQHHGIHVSGHSACLAHLADADRITYLAGLAPGDDIDHRGTTFTEPLLTGLLSALLDPRTGHPQLGEALFRSATFTGYAVFTSVIFTGSAVFISATFTGSAVFHSATFTGNARFDSAWRSPSGVAEDRNVNDDMTDLAVTMWRSPSGVAEDRNWLDRAFQWSHTGGGRPPGRPRIATAWASCSATPSSRGGCPPGRPRIAISAWTATARRSRVAVALRGD